MEPEKKEYGKGFALGALMAAALAGIMKLFDKHFEQKGEKQ